MHEMCVTEHTAVTMGELNARVVTVFVINNNLCEQNVKCNV